MITREDIGRYSTEMLDLIDREKIDSVEGLQARLGESFEARDGIIQLEARPGGGSLFPTDIVLTMSYILTDKAIPLEIRINQAGDYSRIILKSKDMIQSYGPFQRDVQGNMAQDKKMSFSFDEVIRELGRLK